MPNMSEDIVQSSMSLAVKAGETVAQVSKEFLELIMKLLQMQAETNARKAKEKAADKGSKVKSTDLTDIPSGKVSQKVLQEYALKNGVPLVYSQNAVTPEDRKVLEKFAKQNHMPIAFIKTKGGNSYPVIRNSDAELLKICATEMVKAKVAQKPDKLGNFKAESWEIPFIQAELNKYDIPASFVTTKSGDTICIYDKPDEKLVEIARNEFVANHNKLKNDYTITKDPETGFYSFKEERSGREITFDEVPTRSELSSMLQETFGFDENLANMGAAKFGEEMLDGDEKSAYFSDDVTKEFSSIQANVEVEGEDVRVKPYDCWYLAEKTKQEACVVYQNADGRTAILNPQKMTRKKMAAVLQEDLGITDKQEVKALVDKAVKVQDYYANEQTYELDFSFGKDNFDFSDVETVSGMRRTDEDGNVFTKDIPISAISNQIERQDKEKFTVTATASYVETDQNGEEHPSQDQQTLTLSLSDKKAAVQELTALYKKQGIPSHIASEMAKDVFAQAKAQSAEPIALIDKIQVNEQHNLTDGSTLLAEVNLRVGAKQDTVLVDALHPETAAQELQEQMQLPDGAAERIVDDVRIYASKPAIVLLQSYGFAKATDDWTPEQAHEVIHMLQQNHWQVPEGMDPATYDPNNPDSALIDSDAEGLTVADSIGDMESMTDTDSIGDTETVMDADSLSEAASDLPPFGNDTEPPFDPSFDLGDFDDADESGMGAM